MLKIRIILLISLAFINFNLNAQISPEIQKLIEQGYYTQALTKIDQNLISTQNDSELLYLKAQAQYKSGRVLQAIKTYQSIIRLSPLFPDAYNNLAGIYAKQGDLQLAKETLEKGMNTNKSYALLHNNINSIYLEMARESYVKALRLGVKKHNVVLSVATLDQKIIPSKKLVSKTAQSPATSAVNSVLVAKITNKKIDRQTSKPIQVTKYVPNVSKKQASITSPTSSRTAVKVVRRIAGKKKIIIKAWNEPIISTKDEVITALKGWAAAWSAQDVELYLSFYDKHFVPENGTARQIWASQRESRLSKPRWIDVRLSNFLFKQQSDNQAEVSVTQVYRSNNFRDKSEKKFLLNRSDDGWQILNEISFQE